MHDLNQIETISKNSLSYGSFKRRTLLAARNFKLLILILILTVSASGCGFLGNKPSAAGLAASKTARQYIGVPYVYGGRTPQGFDCSGLTAYVFQRHGVKIPRSSSEQAQHGRMIRKRNIQTGDLVFFTTGSGNQVTHVGLYLGNGKFIHAPGQGKKVCISSLKDKYFQKNFHSARRIH